MSKSRKPANFNLFGKDGLSFSLTAGVILWPIVFILTDIINEYFGIRGVQLMSYFSVVFIVLAFLAFFLAMNLTPADWWVESGKEKGVPNMHLAFNAILGQGLWIIVGSIIAFLVGQLLDAFVFKWIKQKTDGKMIWLRATASTLISQFIDSYVVLFIAFWIGAGWDWRLVLAIGLVNYCYKFVVAILLTPALYGFRFAIELFLGKERANELKQRALAV